MKKLSLLMFFAFSILAVYSETIVINSEKNLDFNSLINSYNPDYYYFMDESGPVLPAMKFKIEIDGRALVSQNLFYETSREVLTDAKPIAGENPLPKNLAPKPRSSFFASKGRLPENDFEVNIGYENGKTIIYGYIANFLYEDGRVSAREGKLSIQYELISDRVLNSAEKRILIITEDSLKASWSGYKDFYPDYSVDILSVEDIIALTSPSDSFINNIREYIKYLYENNGLKGVILGGTSEYIPGIYVPVLITPSLSEEDQIVLTDKFYSCLDGSWNYDNDTIYGEIEDSADIFPDILLGRVPVENSEDVNNFLNKVAGFRNITIDTFLAVASYLDANTDGGIHADNMVRLVPITSPVKRLYESLGNLSVFTFIKAINKSPRFISHDGHGNYSVIQSGTGYATLADMDALTNPFPVFMYSLSCLSAGYDHDCIAVHYLFSNGGGYYLGNSRYGWYTPYFPGFGTGDIYNLAFYKNLYNTTSNPVEAINNVFDEFAYEISELNDWRWQFFTLNYFGDPMVSLSLSKTVYGLDKQNSIYKNGIISFTMNVADSIYAEIFSETLVARKVLYPYDNVFSARIDGSDSLLLRVISPDVSDYQEVIYPLANKTKTAYLKGYQFTRMDGESLELNLELITDSTAVYEISILQISDTLLCADADTSILLTAGETNLSFLCLLDNEPSNNTMITVIVDSDTLFIQYGRNLKESVILNVLPDRQNYMNGETGEFKVNISNKNLLSGVILEFEGESLSLDTFPGSQNISFSIPFTVNTPLSFALFYFNLSYGGSQYSKSCKVSANYNSSYMDFEDSRELEVDSSTAYFHKSNNRSLSGLYSCYCGYESSASYPPDYITGIYSDSFCFDTTSFIGFDAYLDIESGMDYLVVYLYSDTLYEPVITLSGRECTFKKYLFNASNYPLFEGRNTRLAFEFYSENDIYQYEGVYIDNILVPGVSYSMGTYELNTRISSKSTSFNPEIEVKKDFLLTKNFSKGSEYSIYDLSGRRVLNGIIQKERQSISITLPNGKFFFSVKDGSDTFFRQFLMLK